MEPQSSFAFLVAVNEAFGYTHKETLDSSFALIASMIKEHNYMMIQRNKVFEKDDELKEDEEWITITDFETGKPKRIKKVKSI